MKVIFIKVKACDPNSEEPSEAWTYYDKQRVLNKALVLSQRFDRVEIETVELFL